MSDEYETFTFDQPLSREVSADSPLSEFTLSFLKSYAERAADYKDEYEKPILTFTELQGLVWAAYQDGIQMRKLIDDSRDQLVAAAERRIHELSKTVGVA